MPDPLKIFIAYSRKDKQFLDELKVHLSLLERTKPLEVWYDGQIVPGVEWDKTIQDQIKQADIILMLISAGAFASKYFYEVEMPNALERHENGEAKVIPFILRSCAWDTTILSKRP